MSKVLTDLRIGQTFFSDEANGLLLEFESVFLSVPGHGSAAPALTALPGWRVKERER